MSRDGHSSVLVKDSIYVMFGINKAGKVKNSNSLQLKWLIFSSNDKF